MILKIAWLKILRDIQLCNLQEPIGIRSSHLELMDYGLLEIVSISDKEWQATVQSKTYYRYEFQDHLLRLTKKGKEQLKLWRAIYPTPRR